MAVVVLQGPQTIEDVYQRAPLNNDSDSRQFRLVQLLSSQAPEPIKCTIGTYTSYSSDCPAYVALSYAWGAKERYDDVDINGNRFPVGRSLWMFLDQMRQQQRFFFFWIDALCINQEDTFERNHQVQMMRKIYSAAHAVWIWLGEADALTRSDAAMAYLATRKPFAADIPWFRRTWTRNQADCLLALCERSYWRRVWIVQEVKLAQQARIWCGAQHIGWSSFVQFTSDLQMLGDTGREFHTVLVPQLLKSPAFAIARAKTDSPVGEPLVALLDQYRNQYATNILDKVYGLHGLASDTAEMPVDYRLRRARVLGDVLRTACISSPWLKENSKPARKELKRIVDMVGEILDINLSAKALDFIIAEATGRRDRLANLTRYRLRQLSPA